MKEDRMRDLPSDPIVFVQDLLAHDPAAIPSSLQVLRRQSWELGQILLYRYQLHQNPDPGTRGMIDMLGCQVFRQTSEGWHPCGGGGFGINYDLPVSHIVQVASSTGRNEQIRYATLYGWAMTSDVAVVEAEFDNGQVLRSDFVVNRVFAVAAADAAQVIQFRVYDRSDRLLKEEVWPPSVP